MSARAATEVRCALRANADDLLAYFERRRRSPDDASDLLGETMLQAWRRHDSIPFGDATRQRMWLFTIAANVLANHRRALRRRTALTDRMRTLLAQDSGAPGVDEASAVRDAVMRLGDAHRELVLLIPWDGLTIVEASTVLGLNDSTARSRYAAARAALRSALNDTAEDLTVRC